MAQRLAQRDEGIMQNVITALKNQLAVYPRLDYAKDSGFVGYDPYTLVKMNRFPFYNITPISQLVEKLDNISFKEMERRTYQLSIQFAARNLKQNIAIMGDDNSIGLLRFQDDIWAGIISDRTLGGQVNGILPGYSIRIDILEIGKEERIFVAGAEMLIEFYRDVQTGKL